MMDSVQARLQISHPGFSLDVDLALPGHKVTALFGPSGSGKTSCLRAIAGLQATSGARCRVVVNGQVWQDDATGVFLPTHQRPLGYVFQEASLFSHLSVAQNLAFGQRRVPVAQRRVSLDQAIEFLGIGHLLKRQTQALSGGERQRVAIARAVATSPGLLLMDEPLAALDAQRKAEILPYFEKLHQGLDIPVIYVSHALDEVARLADHLVVLDAGRAIASGPIATLLTRLDLPLAHGDMASAVITAHVTGHNPAHHLTTAHFAGGELSIPMQSIELGHAVRIRVQARDVSLTLERQTGTSIQNILSATITAMAAETPGHVMVQLDAGGSTLLARLTARSVDVLKLAPGKPVFAQVKGVAILG